MRYLPAFELLCIVCAMIADSHVVTISRFLIEEERKHPEATGAYTNLLQDIA